MPPKPAAAAGPPPEGDPAADLAKARASWSMLSSAYDSQLSSSARTLQQLLEENAFLKKQLAAVKQREMDTYGTHKARAEGLERELDASATRVRELSARLARVPADIKAAADAAKAVMQAEVDDLARRLRDRESALERLADFRRERDDLVGQVTRLQGELAKEVEAHKTDVAHLERRNIKDRELVKREMFAALTEAKARILAQAAEGLDASSRRLLAENEQAVAELAYQSAEAERVSRINEAVVSDNRQLRQDLSLVQDERSELVQRTEALGKALRTARAQLHSALLQQQHAHAGAGDDAAIAAAANAAVQAALRTTTAASGEGAGAAGAPAAADAPADEPAPATLDALLQASGLAASASAAPGGGWRPTPRKHRAFVEEKVKLPRGIVVPPRPGTVAAAPAALLHGAASVAASASASASAFAASDGSGGTGEASAGAHAHSNVALLAAAAMRDRDAALDALVVLDAQRLEMLALADDSALALLRAAAELRPLVRSLAAEQAERDAGRLAARPGAFGEELAALLAAAEAAAPAAAAAATAAAATTSKAAAAATAAASSSSSSADGGASAEGARAALALTLYLSRRMRVLLSDMRRAVPEPAGVDALLQLAGTAGGGGGASTSASAGSGAGGVGVPLSEAAMALATKQPWDGGGANAKGCEGKEGKEDDDGGATFRGATRGGARPPAMGGAASASLAASTALPRLPKAALEASVARRAGKSASAAASAAPGASRIPQQPSYNAYVHDAGGAILDVVSQPALDFPAPSVVVAAAAAAATAVLERPYPFERQRLAPRGSISPPRER